MAGAPNYSAKDRARIIEHVLTELSGGRAVSRILREDDGMCPKSTFWNWCFVDEELMGKVARARENGVECVMDETLEIADDRSRDTLKAKDGSDIADTEWISRSRLRVDTRHKYAQMIAPRKYGPKLDVTSGGEPVKLDDTAIAVRAAALIQKGLDRVDAEPE